MIEKEVIALAEDVLDDAGLEHPINNPTANKQITMRSLLFSTEPPEFGILLSCTLSYQLFTFIL